MIKIQSRYLRLPSLIMIVIINFLLPACGDRIEPTYPGGDKQVKGSTVEPAGCPGNVAVQIQNKSFNPSDITASLPVTVMWTNNDQAVYSVVSSTVPANSLFSTPEILPGYRICLRFTSVGTYQYTGGAAMPQMQGTITIE